VRNNNNNNIKQTKKLKEQQQLQKENTKQNNKVSIMMGQISIKEYRIYRISLAFWDTRAHNCLMLTLSSIRTLRSFPTELLSSRSAPTCNDACGYYSTV